MRTARTQIACLILAAVHAIAPAPPAIAQTEGAVKIRDVTARAQETHLRITVEIDNLFSKKITGTIRSGLPSVVFVEIELFEKDGQRLARRRVLQRISYDIWQERYTVQRDTAIQTFDDFASVQRLGSQVRDIEVADLSHMQMAKRYVVKVRAGISAISSVQSQKLSSWLQESDEVRSDVGSQERASGFQLNLSKLVSFLVGGDKRRGNSSPEYQLEFRLSDLKK